MKTPTKAKNKTMEGLIMLGVVVIAICLNILLYNLIVKNALKKVIRPYFDGLGYVVERTEFVGLFSKGDFKSSGFSFRPFMPMGQPIKSIYVYLHLKNRSEQKKSIRITAKIETVFLLVKKVEYSKTI